MFFRHFFVPRGNDLKANFASRIRFEAKLQSSPITPSARTLKSLLNTVFFFVLSLLYRHAANHLALDLNCLLAMWENTQLCFLDIIQTHGTYRIYASGPENEIRQI